MRETARQFRVHLRTVQRWVARAQGARLDRADLASRRRGPHLAARRVAKEIEESIIRLRRELKEHSPLGEYGAKAIHQALCAQQFPGIPSVRTIGRILERRGVLDGNRRIRRQPPPRGWYLADLAALRVEMDSFDIVEGLVIRGGTDVSVLNGISVHGGLCVSWPAPVVTAKMAVDCLVAHWRACGLPQYAQFDNDTIFQGAHHYPDSFGRVIRLCVSLGVVPVFAPPRETGFQAAIESYNGRWQAKVWSRFVHADLAEVCMRSEAYVAAARQRAAARIDAAPVRRPFPPAWKLNLQASLQGQVIYIRRADAAGKILLLGHHLAVSENWPHRLVKAVVDLTAGRISFHALRRRQADHQPLLGEIDYAVPTKRFKE